MKIERRRWGEREREGGRRETTSQWLREKEREE